MTVRTRFAPSPTGFLHIGGARTALYCWLEARHRGGEFILRIEDTDRERSTEAAVQAILDGMNWLGLSYDEGPYYQTLRMDRYRQVAEDLVKAGKAYYAYESKGELEAMRAQQMEKGIKPRYAGIYRDRNEPAREDANRVVRFRNPSGGSVVFNDKVKGRIEWNNEELDDLVMVRSGNGAIELGDSLVGSKYRAPGERAGGTFTKSHQIVVHAGDLVRIPATVPHAFIVSGPEPLQYLVIKQRRQELLGKSPKELPAARPSEVLHRCSSARFY